MRVTALLLATVLLAACDGGSGSNPLGSLASNGSGSGSLGSGSGSFGSGGARADEGEDADVVVADESILMPSFESAVIEPARRGAILRVTAFAPTQGYYDARLAPRNGGEPDQNGVVTYELRAVAPSEPQSRGGPATRQLIVAAFLPDDLRQSARVIRVLTATKAVDLRP